MGGILLKGLSIPNKNVNRRLPFNTKLLEYSRHRCGIDDIGSEKRPDRAWAATLIGFMSLLRASELAALAVKDVTFGEHEGTRYVRIFIRKSKTDQGEFGAFRTMGEPGKNFVLIVERNHG